MNTKLTSVCVSFILAASVAAMADEPANAARHSPEFERLKTLVGTWKGTTDMGQGPVEMTVQYRLLATGSVLEERVFAGTPHEMVTMYYDKGGKLALTHYCVLGNRPAMLLKASDQNTLQFDFDATCGLDPAKESHMHALTIRFDDQDTITTSCKAVMDGKEKSDHAVTLKRVRS